MGTITNEKAPGKRGVRGILERDLSSMEEGQVITYKYAEFNYYKIEKFKKSVANYVSGFRRTLKMGLHLKFLHDSFKIYVTRALPGGERAKN